VRGFSVVRTTDRVSVRSRYLMLRLSVGRISGTDRGSRIFNALSFRPMAVDVQKCSFQFDGTSHFFAVVFVCFILIGSLLERKLQFASSLYRGS
jgi:hypothetical protein